MDYPIIFARHFSRLVWLLLHEPANTDEQKAALRALVTVSKDGPVHLATQEWRLVANGKALPDLLTGVQELSAQMIGHAVKELHVGQAASAGDLLGAARILAAEPVPGDGGAAAGQKLRSLAGTTVHFVVGIDPGPAKAAPASAPTPSGPAVMPAGDTNPADLAMDLELVDPDEAHAAISEKYKAEAGVAVDADRPPPIVASSPEEMMGIFGVHVASGDAQELFRQFDSAASAQVKSMMLEEISGLAERSGREGKAMLVADILGGIAQRETQSAENSEAKRLLGRAFRRLAKANLLRQIAMLLPRKRGRIEEYEAVLMRAGEEGADALIDQLTQATTAEDRRTYYNLLLQLRAGVPALVHMLGDHRWYVVRNAADLLGEMQANEAEQPLVLLLRHGDERVRRAASTALVRLGTPVGLGAVREAMRDENASVRLLAATALSQRKDNPTAQTLVRALDKEEDEEVQMAIVAALGRVGTPDAVQRLVAVAEPGGRFFKKKSTALRVAAVQGLGDARTAAALATLTSLAEDREKEVREAAVRALSKRE